MALLPEKKNPLLVAQQRAVSGDADEILRIDHTTKYEKSK